jgi:hypothetical protein
MAHFIITESQYKRLLEGAMETFSLQRLSSITNFRDRLNYCKQELGPSIGGGSSRVVFQIDDEKVLKLAKNKKGLAQNEAEGKPEYVKDGYSMFPKKFEYDENYSWIVSEYVLPAKEQDFQQVLGMTSKEFFNIIYNIWYDHNGYGTRFNNWDYKKIEDMSKIWELTEDYDSIFYELNDFLGNYDYIMVGDLLRIANWGMTIRNGEPYMVILDSGCTEDVYDSYYKRK